MREDEMDERWTKERNKDDELKPVPSAGEHQVIVEEATQRAIAEHRDLLEGLARQEKEERER